MNLNPIQTLNLVEITFNAAGHPQEAASQVQRPKAGGNFVRPINTNGHGFTVLDYILNKNGNLNLIEANGSNAAGSSFGSSDGDLARAMHQVEAARERIEKVERGVVLISYANGTGAMPEIITRAALVRDLISSFRSCDLADTLVGLGESAITVVVDTVEKIADSISVHDGALHFAGVPVVSAGNPNILPALVRRGVVAREGTGYAVETSVFHDGPLVSLVHNKAAQQAVAAGTGIVPLHWRECYDMASCAKTVAEMQALGLASVAKPNGGSGGAGIEFFGPTYTSEEVAQGLARVIEATSSKYGDNIDRSVWPLRLFEFVESTGYPLADGDHLWDIRIVCLIRPGAVDLTFSSIRVCPEPFIAGRFEKGTVLSNVTGRRPNLSTTLSPLVEFGKPTEHLQAGGVDEEILEKIIDASAKWCEAAWAHSVFSAASAPRRQKC